MKKVLFDLMSSQPDAKTKFHGGGEYIKTVFNELCNYKDQVKLFVFYNPDCFLDDWIYKKIQTCGIETNEVHGYPEVEKLVAFQQADIFFAGLMTSVHFIEFPQSIKVIGVYHGFRSLELPIEKTAPLYEESLKGKVKEYVKILGYQKYYQKKYQEMKNTIEKCNIVIGDSEHSGYSAKMLFPEIDIEKVKIFYAPEKHVEPVKDIEYVQTERMVLMLGGNRWTKNVYRGIIALDQLFSVGQMQGYTVKIVGGIPNDIEKKIINKNRFISLGYLSAEELEKTYKACDFFFYPTLNEGFGYPPLEVMKYGKTCLISAVTSLPEIYRDSVYYCNPYDIKEMKTRLLQVVENKKPKETIAEAYKRIANRQRRDLKSLCELITG